MVNNFKSFLKLSVSKSIYEPNIDILSDEDLNLILDELKTDYSCYYKDLKFEIENLKFFPGLLATTFYRISRYLFIHQNDENNALQFSCLGYFLTGIELYYSAKIGHYFKINHGSGTVVGARSIVGDRVILHHNVTLGDKNGGRPSLGNNVIVYPGSVIVGNICIGDNSIIGANKFVDKNIENNSIFK